MNRWLAIAALACACSTCKDAPKQTEKVAPEPSRPLGEIKQGVRISYRLGEVPGVDRSTAFERAVTVMRRRLRLRGVDGAVGHRGEFVVLELPGISGTTMSTTARAISSGGALSFHLVHEYERDKPRAASYALMQKLHQHVINDAEAKALHIVGVEDQWQHDATGEHFYDYFLQAHDRNLALPRGEANRLGCVPVGLVPLSDGTRLCKLSGRTVLARYLTKLAKQHPKLSVDTMHQIAFEPVCDRNGRQTGNWRTHLVYRTPVLRGVDVDTATVVSNPITQRPEVLVTMTDDGRKQLARVTAQNKGRRMAIILGGVVHSAPVIEAVIDGGEVSISGRCSDRQVACKAADILVRALRGGALPAHLIEERSERIGG